MLTLHHQSSGFCSIKQYVDLLHTRLIRTVSYWVAILKAVLNDPDTDRGHRVRNATCDDEVNVGNPLHKNVALPLGCSRAAHLATRTASGRCTGTRG